MSNSYTLYLSIWCPIEEARECVNKSQSVLKELIGCIRKFTHDCGIIFIELTEESLKNLPVHMVDKMTCFNRENLNTSVFNISEIMLKHRTAKEAIKNLEMLISELMSYGFKGEMVIVKEIKIKEENIGKTVCKKNYEVFYNKKFLEQ